ncbi:hypothetical protein P9112_000085 [Eukaryota sp. TZLM1-RC]
MSLKIFPDKGSVEECQKLLRVKEQSASLSQIHFTLHILNNMKQQNKNDNEVTDSAPTSLSNLLFTKQQGSSSRTPQSKTVVLHYKNKRKITASVSERKRRSDPFVEVEYCTFLGHHVSHDMGAVESAIVIITLDMRCFSCLCVVLNLY